MRIAVRSAMATKRPRSTSVPGAAPPKNPRRLEWFFFWRGSTSVPGAAPTRPRRQPAQGPSATLIRQQVRELTKHDARVLAEHEAGRHPRRTTHSRIPQLVLYTRASGPAHQDCQRRLIKRSSRALSVAFAAASHHVTVSHGQSCHRPPAPSTRTKVTISSHAWCASGVSY